jgi:hypothetical protein
MLTNINLSIMNYPRAMQQREAVTQLKQVDFGQRLKSHFQHATPKVATCLSCRRKTEVFLELERHQNEPPEKEDFVQSN